MTKEEIKAFLKREEVKDYLKEHISVEISIEPTEFLGYDIEATAYLDDEEIASNDDFI